MKEYVSKRYTLINTIDEGGMAKIYLATDNYNSKKVAIKILSTNKNTNVVYRKRFEREINLTMRIRSEFVVKIFDYYLNEKVQYIVMEYIEGETLKSKIRRRVSLTSDETVSISKNIIQGLVDIHNEGIIHRDIKSLNILIRNDGSAKIIDLGISIDGNSESLTKTNSIIGSAHYLAPEIIEGGRASCASDIYALGILMYEMLTGYLPFDDNDYRVVAKQHVSKEVPSILKHNPNVRQSILNIVKKATAKSPLDRYKTAKEMHEDLKTALDNNRLHEKEIILSSENQWISFSQILTNKWYWVIFLLILIIIIIIVTFFLFGRF